MRNMQVCLVLYQFNYYKKNRQAVIKGCGPEKGKGKSCDINVVAKKWLQCQYFCVVSEK